MIDVFTLKKIVSMFVHLIPGVPLLMFLFLLLRRVLPRFSMFIIWICCLTIIAASIPQVSNTIVSRLEDRYPVMQSLPADSGLVIVLGYGHIYDPMRPINSILTPVALSRLTEAVRLWKTKPSIKLVVSGASQTAPSHAATMEEMALELGVPQSHLVRLDQTRDTEDEIVSAIRLLSDQPGLGGSTRLVVVSSAIHLPRVAMLLDEYDVRYSLAPTEYIVSNKRGHLPGASTLFSTDRAVHEWVGILWYRLRNRLLADQYVLVN